MIKHQGEEIYCHDLERGDHVIRWTSIFIYPFQVHGIVLSAGPNIVTIVDFGLTATKSQREGAKVSFENEKQLEDMLDQEDKAMIKTCEEHRKKHKGKDRVNIITLVDEKEIRQWKKVNYGESLQKQQNWRWWKRREEQVGEATMTTTATTTESDASLNTNNENIEICEEKKGEVGCWWNLKGSPKNGDGNGSNKPSQVPKLPKSDPTFLVLSRVRYILNHPHELPPHHILFSNSECIAVFCKTGRWSTLQASIFLYSTAAGNLKTAILSSAGVAGATTTVTVPASGIAGWFGMTTTTTVSLLSVQPWLIPVLAGYGLIAVGTPIVLAAKAKEKWEHATIRLNDGFWSCADSDVYVEAIKAWSNI
jgi:hypothetical protein